MPIAFLLAMQAAGIVVDWLGSKQQQELQNYAAGLNQAGIEANIEQVRLESENSSVQAMKNLRQQLGTQIAVQSARGTRLTGSAYSIFNQSIGNFNADERTRRLNLLGKENQLRAGIAMSRLQNMTENSKLWQSFAQRTINRFPSSLSGWQSGIGQVKEGFGLTSQGT